MISEEVSVEIEENYKVINVKVDFLPVNECRCRWLLQCYHGSW